MNSEQLLNIVKTDPCLNLRVKGVYASNTLPQFVTQYPSAFIINTQPLPLPGEHWIAIIVHSPLRAEFFDSLGHTPADYNQDIQNFLEKKQQTMLLQSHATSTSEIGLVWTLCFSIFNCQIVFQIFIKPCLCFIF